MTYQILDNFLDPADHLTLKTLMLGDEFSWNYHYRTTANPQSETDLDDFYFVHHFYQAYEPRSRYINLLMPIIAKINPKAIIRIKGNLYTRTSLIKHHLNHMDYRFDHEAAIYYVNSNDGLTVLDDGTQIESVENRLLVFDASKNHHSTTCTNAKARVNINFNYV